MKIVDLYNSPLMLSRERLSSELAGLHIKAFPDSLLTSFGKSYLITLYSTLVKEAVIFFILLDGNKIKGAIIGSRDISKISYSKSLIVTSLFRSCFIRPKLLLNICLSFMVSLDKNFKVDFTPSNIELSFFMVDPSLRSQGHGSSLLRYFEKQCDALNVNQIYTRTHNPRLVDFYIQKKSGSIKNFLNCFNISNWLVFWRISL